MAPTDIVSFAQSDICTDIHNLNADIAIFMLHLILMEWMLHVLLQKGSPCLVGGSTKEREHKKYSNIK